MNFFNRTVRKNTFFIMTIGLGLIITACSSIGPFPNHEPDSNHQDGMGSRGGGMMDGKMMRGMMNGNERMGGMMEGERGDGTHDDHGGSSHSYLPLTPLSSHLEQPSYRPGAITELEGRLTNGNVKEFKVTAAPQPVEISEGITIESWAYNGEIPGPLLRVKEGERVRMIFENQVPNIKTAIHWHGLLVPNSMDGVPPMTQSYIGSGERFVYEFDAKPSGTHWFHAHSMGDGARQLDQGLISPIIIDPIDKGWMPETEQEWIMALDEWQIEGVGPAPPSNDGSMMGQGMMGKSNMMKDGGMGNHLLGTADGYNLFTINGRANLQKPFEAEAGKWVRLRLLNGGFQQHTIHIHGLKAWVTHTDGHLLPSAQPAEELVISPYERLDVLLYGATPGEYRIHDHDTGHSEAGMQARIKLVESSQKEDFSEGRASEDQLPIVTRPSRAPLYQNLIAGIPGKDTYKYDRRYDLTIGMGMGRNSQWTLNGQSGENSEPLLIRDGERIRLSISNMSPESHPMHLHGHEFEVVEVNGRSLVEPWLLKDTLNLKPMESYTLSFTANSGPGDWLFHCHQGHHADDGLMTIFRYSEL
jgi:FtsP/CotA-like multicopper oxidase with cupredoxin domain